MVKMSIIDKLKAKYRHRITKKHIKTVRRRQFNLTISEEIIQGVKLLAAALHVPRYIITEHLLQVGAYHILKDIEDEDKRRKLEEHLMKVHLLGDDLGDNDVFVIFGSK